MPVRKSGKEKGSKKVKGRKLGKKENENRKKRGSALREAFVKVLVRTPVKDVRFSRRNRQISLTFLGDRFSYPIIVKREVHVGGWTRRKEEIHIDKEVSCKEHGKSFKALCVHEAIEKHLVEKYGLKTDGEAHIVATKKERQFLKSIGGNWRSHQLVVYHLWERLDGH